MGDLYASKAYPKAAEDTTDDTPSTPNTSGIPDDLPHTDTGRVDIARLYESLDGRVWADEFCKVNPGLDLGTMTGWFANCIETTKQILAQRERDSLKLHFSKRPEFTTALRPKYITTPAPHKPIVTDPESIRHT